MKYSKKYSVGEFAQLCRTTKDTLFHYQNLKLLKPSINKENHYREYNPEQFLTFQMIQLLKQSGCTLIEIEDYLYHQDKSMLPYILAESRQRLENKLKETKRSIQQMHRIERTLSYVQNEENIQPHIEIWEEPQYIVTSDVRPANLSPDEWNIASLRAHFDFCETMPMSDKFPIGVVLSTLEENMPLTYRQIFSYSDAFNDCDDKNCCHILPAGPYLCCLHKNGGRDLEATIFQLCNYVRENHLTPLKSLYACNMVDAFTVFHHEDYVMQFFTRIQ